MNLQCIDNVYIVYSLFISIVILLLCFIIIGHEGALVFFSL